MRYFCEADRKHSAAQRDNLTRQPYRAATLPYGEGSAFLTKIHEMDIIPDIIKTITCFQEENDYV